MRTRDLSLSQSRGFSLIEVLVAVVILSFGLLALSALQGSLFRASAEAKAQSVGLGLATEKLEYFRGYKNSDTYRALDAGADATVGAPLTVGGVNYTRSWTVARYAYPEAGGNFTSVANTSNLGAVYAANNEFKRISVSVGWTDAVGNPQSVTIEDAIAAIDPGDSRKVAKQPGTARPRGPEVKIFTPASQQEGVIPIAIGDGTSETAATNPKPLINAGNVIETRFDILTYSGISGSTATSQSRIQTSVAGCKCDTATADTTELALRPTYWNGVSYVVPESASYLPPAGQAAGASSQSALCTMCCRDHHDPGGLAPTAARFNPRHAGHSVAPAGHFLLNESTGELTASAGPYTEVCRIIRVGGFFRVAADTYNDYLNVLDTNSLALIPDAGKALYVPTLVATTNYQNFVKGYLNQRIVNQTSEAAFNTVLATNIAATSAIEKTHSLNAVDGNISVQAPTNFPVGLPKWLHLRGLYIDYLEPSAVQAIKDAKDNCSGTTQLQLETCVLRVLPFTSINLTELGRWTPVSGTQIVVASNNFASTLGTTEPVRGKVVRGSAATEGDTAYAVATSRRSNSGLTTLIGGISTNDAAVTTPSTWTATQPFTIVGAPSASGGSFNVSLEVGSANAAYPYAANALVPYILSNHADVVCNPPIGGLHPCTSSDSLGGAQTLTFGNYNYQLAGTSNASIPCSNGTTTNFYTGPYSTKVCRNYAVTSVTGAGVADILAVNLDGERGETTEVELSAVSDGGNVVVTFGVPVDTPQPLVQCSYSCNNKNCNKPVYEVVFDDCP